jgi:N-carbamoyl-L-amino-acid hydrolase
MAEISINSERLWQTITETARFGATPGGGLTRLTLSDADREVRDWLVARCNAMNLAVTIDEVGNIFALRPGKDPDRLPVAMGSHLDTQPQGGRFDGILGVLASLEVMHILSDHGFVTEAPLCLVNWTNEEGSRFVPTMLASGVYAGIYTADYARGRQDSAGKTFGEELARIGYRGPQKAGAPHLARYFELHIEQGPVLESEKKDIGVVTGAQAQRWYDVEFTGQENHAATPMPLRRDPMLALSLTISTVQKIALRHAPLAVGTIGHVALRPNSRNTVPGAVFLTVDLRHPDDAVLAQMHQTFTGVVHRLARDTGLGLRLEPVLDSPAVHFDPGCLDMVRQAADKLGLSRRDIVSGPGHDAIYVSRVVPTAMIFVPCAGGISHSEKESTTPEQAARGANVLLGAVLRAADAAPG